MRAPDPTRRKFAAGALACGLLGTFGMRPAFARPDADDDQIAVALTGGRFVHEVVAGDHLTAIGARFGVDPAVLARENGLGASTRLRPGQLLQIDNRHLAPAGLDDGILINIPQRMLYWFEGARPLAAWPAALGKPDWATPTGAFQVASLERDKPWIVPKSIQEEMRREGKPVITRVEPGPDNPLGRHWIGLSLPGYGIHGTIAPTSIYGFRSHGCVRMHPDDVAALFARLVIGSPGRLVYQPTLLGRCADDRIHAEIHRDPYRRSPVNVDRIRRLADREGLSDRIDWERVRDAVRAQDGIARDVELSRPTADPAKS